MLASFTLALQFLTRLPVNLTITHSDQRLGQSVLFYPLIGLLIGTILILVNYLLPPHSIALNAAILLTVWVLLTGGLHLDGLADCCDAWAGGLGDRERTLSIMKDPAAGPIAVIFLILILLIKWTALQDLIQSGQGLSFLLLTPFLGRLSILLLMLSTPYIRKNGLGSAMQTHLPKLAAKLIIIVSLVLCFWLTNIYTLLTVLTLTILIRQLALQRIQGVAGDVYGASVELIETGVLISMALSNG
ncbi:adenosylcobinamide-GDP ribazoletransferase [Bathymodiolus platifrons methanotrophic gill symbiont]|uniref:adenosylcobinamide-GDP ribazoletransferase n=1 Tax=Bathymodiolus platifrons methanotrophic gill symbiont TaxID=113268 RepID=UPI000B40D8C5|nr:adenosylcobinamide-GDP ribazoletransferase [Bathymodiolus platifrons methanotrophic gill symbiont]GAW86742.1 adenosylcobinamide-GDP ribazoletransferase [Bathymodiolus platifrons methanotrophic gill symbiont]